MVEDSALKKKSLVHHPVFREDLIAVVVILDIDYPVKDSLFGERETHDEVLTWRLMTFISWYRTGFCAQEDCETKRQRH